MKYKQRAKVLATLSKTPMLLFAGSNKVTASIEDLTNEVEFSKHECASCGTQVAFGTDVDGIEPYCPTCGGEDFTVVSVEPIPVEQYTDEEVSLATCPNCGAHNAYDDRILASLDGHVHCAACGHEMQAADDVDDNIYDVTATEDVEDSTEDDVDDTNVEDKEPEMSGFGKKRKSVKASENTNPDLNANDLRVALDDPPVNTNGEINDGVKDAPVINTNEDLNTEFADVDMLDNADDNADVEIVQQACGDGSVKLLAFANGIHVASLTTEDAGDKADVIGNRHFHDALEQEAKSHGCKCLSKYGFKPVVAKIGIAKLVNARVAKELTAQTAALTATKEDVKADFHQALSIAVAALNAGYYRNRKNPLAVTLTAALKAMGIGQAESIVKRAVQAASQEFIDEAMDLTEEVMEKPLELRNELADNLSEIDPNAQFQTTDEAEDEPLADAAENVTARLLKGGRVTKSKGKSEQAKSVQVASNQDALNISALVAQARSTRF